MRRKQLVVNPDGIKGIWILTNVWNNYDQPDNNLVYWWYEKPTFQALADALGLSFNNDETILDVENLHQHGERRIGNHDWKLRKVAEGQV